MVTPSGRHSYSSSSQPQSDTDNREPGPIYSYTRVRLGDVGYVRRGRFHLLFSAGIPLGSRTLGTDVPLTFEPLDVGPVIPGEARSPGYLRTKTVRQIGADVGGSVAVACTVEPGAKLAFELTQKRGAALITRDLTYREDIEREHTFEIYIKQHYDSWVDFARELGHGKDISPVLVTGVDLTREFASVAYSDNQTRMECEFSAGVPGVASTSVSVWGSWHTQELVHTNCGPRHPNRQNRSLGESTVPESEIPDGYSQCVFIRYYTIRRRIFVPIVLKAGAGPHQLPRGNRDDTTCEEGLQVLSVIDSTEVDHPGTGSPGDAFDEVIHNISADDRDGFDVVAEFVFQRSDAKSVLLHHHDIQEILQGDEEELSRLLAESGTAGRIEVDENGVGRLLGPTATRLLDSNTDNGTHGQILPIQTSAAVASTQLPEGRNGAFSSLNAAIEALDIAEETSNIVPVKAVFGSVSVLLTMIKDSMISERDYVDLGLSCADVCRVLDRGTDGGKLDDLSQSVCEAINQLTTIVTEIQRKVIGQSGQNAIPRLAHTKNDKDAIAAWELDLNRILHVFNTGLVVNTHLAVPELRRDVSKFREEIGGRIHSTRDRILGELPPPPPRVFFGRDDLVQVMLGLAENLTPIALIGPGGIGKTAAALVFLHHDRIKKRFGINRRFLKCDEFLGSFTHFLRRLSMVVGAGIENPEDLAPLRGFLSSKEMVIVLDNAESILDPSGRDAQKIYYAVEELGRFNNICICITSCISATPPDCKRLDIPTLWMDPARDTFYSIYNDHDQSNPEVNDILEQLDFHPLSIVLLATVARQSIWDIARLVEEWRRQRTRLLYTRYNKGLATAIELSLASPTFQRLGPNARALLKVIAFFPQGVDENNLDWLFPTVPDAINVFDKMCVLSLTYRRNGFITMLAPLQDYLRPEDPKSSSLLRAAREQYFTRMAVDLNPNTSCFGESRWITSEDVNVEYLLDVFTTIDVNSESVWDACADFMRHLFWHKKRLTILEPKIEGLPDDHRSKPECLFELSRLFGSVGNQAERKRILIHALKLWRERGSNHWVARALVELSDTDRLMGLYKEGIRLAKEALGILEQVGDTAEQAQCLVKLVLLFCSDERLDAAEEAASRMINLLPEKGEQFQVWEYHLVLGKIYQSKGQRGTAVHHYEMALEIASSFGWHDQLFWVHYNLAGLFLDEDRFDDAHAHVEQAKSYAVNGAYNLGCAMEQQARVWYKQERLKEAKSDVLRAVNIYEKLGAARDLERCRELLQDI